MGATYWWGGEQQTRPNWEYQRNVLSTAQTAYFLALVITQWANLVVCKTRKLSVFQQVGGGGWGFTRGFMRVGGIVAVSASCILF